MSNMLIGPLCDNRLLWFKEDSTFWLLLTNTTICEDFLLPKISGQKYMPWLSGPETKNLSFPLCSCISYLVPDLYLHWPNIIYFNFTLRILRLDLQPETLQFSQKLLFWKPVWYRGTQSEFLSLQKALRLSFCLRWCFITSDSRQIADRYQTPTLQIRQYAICAFTWANQP